MINNKKICASLLLLLSVMMLSGCSRKEDDGQMNTGQTELVMEDDEQANTGQTEPVMEDDEQVNTGQTEPVTEDDIQMNAGQTELVTEHDGIYVYTGQDTDKNRCRWFPDEESFLREFGFDSIAPFYEYNNIDGNLQMTLYYDEQAEKGMGIRYYERDVSTFNTTGIYGFIFDKVNEEQWTGWELDYTEIPSLEESEDVEDYRENYEYDSENRLIHFDASGILKVTDDTESSALLWIDYIYHDNGLLRHRSYWHNFYQFGTWSTTRDSDFDELGRLLYEDIYVTHGSEDYYYIYGDEDKYPEYCLMLDCNLGNWIPKFICYGK